MGAMSKKLVIGNWKLHPDSFEEAERIIKTLSKVKVPSVSFVVCPPAVYLSRLSKGKKGFLFGVQDVFYESAGAYTGEYSATMAKSVGAQFAIVGHSERRALGETNTTVSKKALAAIKGRLTAVVCVGEKERDTHGHYLSYLKAQLDESLEGISKHYADKLVIAYEPLWAIGEKAIHAVSPRDLHEMVLFVRKVLHDSFGKRALSIPILYGGSVDSENAVPLLKEGMANGLLIGRESVKADHFAKIIRSVGSV